MKMSTTTPLIRPFLSRRLPRPVPNRLEHFRPLPQRTQGPDQLVQQRPRDLAGPATVRFGRAVLLVLDAQEVHDQADDSRDVAQQCQEEDDTCGALPVPDTQISAAGRQKEYA